MTAADADAGALTPGVGKHTCHSVAVATSAAAAFEAVSAASSKVTSLGDVTPVVAAAAARALSWCHSSCAGVLGPVIKPHLACDERRGA